MNMPPLRIGLGYDTHCLGNGGPLRVGGIDIEGDLHALGHSDADVLLHAITDALLGAADCGDIGQLFPDTDPENRGRDSAEFLAEAIRLVRAAGWEVTNIDCVLLAQRPKIAPYIDEIRQRIGEIANLYPTQIGIKGKTGEGIGPIGHSEAIAARCVALLHRVG
ncbi:2-C-methyl-D-erythritol 2,4-cyclodiphosphate synthase [Roseimaritima multifibrata]|uniref:2-C-methyl-D-erythritol 2,4-cyclodiphosphate synthase n=2 Tax=Roseimaritima multifibrata TaxID=1930274 RepID=A0A517MN68_9BACT|nr:2-C-methyl-D-erythritol 2,4-cyclodiphosphate synthase [Roseimaritima multifibrata]QDS96304.1 2-C-methyl-D-erythritol 2,4-cyclodiphosphate synthase [Roseimaritima multifibrata]